MEASTLLPDPQAIRPVKIIPSHSSLTLVVKATRTQAECPRCHRPSTRVHRYYTRKVADLPWHAVSVRLELRTRRFRCRNSLCTKRVFCERLPGVVAHYTHKISCLIGRKLQLGSGQPAKRRGMPAAPSGCACASR